MKVEDLKCSVEEIHMKDTMRKQLIDNIKARTGSDAGDYEVRRKTREGEKRMTTGIDESSYGEEKKITRWYRVATAAAVLIVVSGIIVFPVRAFVHSLVQERMEAMPEEKVDEILETANSSLVEADSFSRAYTDSESSRYESLAQKYQAGTFPEKEIMQVDSDKDVKEDELCFIVSNSTFSLPDRELTDEEILEIIDFYVKRDYAYQQNYEKEYAEEIAQEAEQQKEQIADNVAEGGITEQEAIEIATEKLQIFFGISGEGMELNSYYSEEGHRAGGAPCYYVNWSNVVTHQIYYLAICAKDGQVVWVDWTNPASLDMPEPTIEEAKGKIDGLGSQAEEFMRDKAGVSYEKEYIYYLEYADGTVHRGVRFIFETEDHETYGVTYLWDGTFDSYAELDISDYQDGGIRTLHMGSEEVELKVVFQELSIK